MNGSGQMDGVGSTDIIFGSDLGSDSSNWRRKAFDFNDRKVKKLVIGMNNRSGIFLEG